MRTMVVARGSEAVGLFLLRSGERVRSCSSSRVGVE